MLGRQVGSSLLRLPANARLVLRPSPFQCQHDLTSRFIVASSIRPYATPARTGGRPKKAVGEPSRPVKRSVKRAAKSASSGEAGELVKANKDNARAKKATTKKPAAKKKAAPKKLAKKVLTEEQKVARLASKKAKTERDKIKAWKVTALSPPPNGTRLSAYNVFVKEKTKGRKIDTSSTSVRAAIGERIRDVQQEWKALSPAELEHYNHLAQQEKEVAVAEYKRWVESHTADQIKAANNARQLLRRRFTAKNSTKWQSIKDERAVKRPVSAYIQFSVNRHASGDFKNIALADRAKLISQEWKTLNESEKKKYKDLQFEDRSRYSTEYNDVFGHPPPKMEPLVATA